MKTNDILILGGAALAVLALMRWGKGGAAPAGVVQTGQQNPRLTPTGGFVEEVFDWRGLPYANGWRYFENGTAIDPAGAYYLGGVKVWEPAK